MTGCVGFIRVNWCTAIVPAPRRSNISGSILYWAAAFSRWLAACLLCDWLRALYAGKLKQQLLSQHYAHRIFQVSSHIELRHLVIGYVHFMCDWLCAFYDWKYCSVIFRAYTLDFKTKFLMLPFCRIRSQPITGNNEKILANNVAKITIRQKKMNMWRYNEHNVSLVYCPWAYSVSQI